VEQPLRESSTIDLIIFRRASLPVFFARGTTRPDAGGRALLALLACAAERLSARRFAEYVSLAQVPDPDASRDPDARWVPPADDLLPTGAPELPPVHDERSRMPDPDPDTAAVIEGTLRAPWRWERLLVDASVIGEQKRWAGRLAGLGATEHLFDVRHLLDRLIVDCQQQIAPFHPDSGRCGALRNVGGDYPLGLGRPQYAVLDG